MLYVKYVTVCGCGTLNVCVYRWYIVCTLYFVRVVFCVCMVRYVYMLCFVYVVRCVYIVIYVCEAGPAEE